MCDHFVDVAVANVAVRTVQVVGGWRWLIVDEQALVGGGVVSARKGYSLVWTHRRMILDSRRVPVINYDRALRAGLVSTNLPKESVDEFEYKIIHSRVVRTNQCGRPMLITRHLIQTSSTRKQ